MKDEINKILKSQSLPGKNNSLFSAEQIAAIPKNNIVYSRSAFERVVDSSFTNIDTKSKQFHRYKLKIKESVVDLISKAVSNKKQSELTFENIILFYIANNLFGATEENPFSETTSKSLMHTLTLPDYMFNFTPVGKDFYQNVIDYCSYFIENGYPQLSKTKNNDNLDNTQENNFETIFSEVLKRFLTYKLSTDADLNTENYIRRTLPLTPEDTFRIIIDLADNTLQFVLFLYLKDYTEGMMEDKYSVEKNKYETEISELKEIIKKDNIRNEERINNLKSQVGILELEIKREKASHIESEEAFKELLAANRKLKKKENKISKSYNNLVQKYNLLAEQFQTQKEEAVSLSENISLDMNGRYVFFADESKTTFASNILKEFPNAKITKTPDAVSSDAVDMVIIMTELIDHPSYYSLKEICKTKGIPFIHCSFQNINIIKQTMESYINSL